MPPRAVPAGTRAVFVLVPGMLGYGWEWDQPKALLDAAPATVTQVFSWSPWSSLGRVAEDFAHGMNALSARLPESVERVVIIGHSAGGLITAFAAPLLIAPPGRRILVVNVGAPYPGMHTTPFDSQGDVLWAPFVFALGDELKKYPAPAARIDFESFVTAWPGDPVMQPRFGHHPDNPGVGPPGPRRRLPSGIDHNHVLEVVIRELLARRNERLP
ncbi:MAG: hypothetical protein EXR72_06715 [Myxococcales bacterium]|nr:hypothetical protein [Myxococcales bacterium]